MGHGAVPFLMCCWKASGASRRPETTAVHRNAARKHLTSVR
ncbi:hypothetical protein HMPREF3036_02430 [Sutterella sp. KLE1602]|nr:hypothetical protein HMPREF3036_02430 [Sutterella sp. KLE1602]